MRTFNSLANLTAACRLPDWRCARLLHYGAAPGSKIPAPNTLRTLISIARNPWHDVRGLMRLSHQVQLRYQPALTRKQRPPAWTLALRFEGVPETMNGPGNIAIDARGSLWVINNYEYTRNPLGNPCAGEQLLRFTPTGRGFPGSPYEGGGINGAGFGVSFDPKGRLWVGNFGFEAKDCTTTSPKNSVSLFNAKGEALSPDLQRASVEIKGKTVEVTKGGFEQGGIDQPQGVVSDREGNVWIANCGNSSVTHYAEGEPEVATNIGSGVTGLQAPFDIAVNTGGTAFVTGNGSDSVAILGPNGVPTANSPVTGHGLHRPMGIAADSRGYMWVSNSAKVVLGFCPEAFPPQEGAGKGSVVLIKPNGEPFRERPFKGAGMETPWGIAVDGKDTVWVANFTGQRLSQVCGARPKLCPPGKREIGKAISPSGRGYAFDGLTRNTGVQVDPSGNVWLANNWKQKAIQTNPGGYQLVAYLGIAAPIKTPLIGPPERP
jgi:sugar lactone lactonase YvrE